MKRHIPGSKWRLRAVDKEGRGVDFENVGHFDEIVVDHWLHVEQMSQDNYWLKVGDAHIWIEVAPDGFAKKVTLTEGAGRVLAEDGAIALQCDWRPPKKKAVKKRAPKR